MSDKVSSLRKRLERAERKLIDLVNQEKDPECSCRAFTIADPRKPEEFEAEMKGICRIHGCRQLGSIVHVKFVGQEDAKSIKLDQLLQSYRASQSPREIRLSQLRQIGMKLKNGY